MMPSRRQVEWDLLIFRGYFFCQPEKNRKAEIDSSKVSLVRLLAEINSKTTTRERVVEIIQGDVTLSYKILKYINSSYFYRLNKRDSVPHAIAYLGDVEFRRFVILMLISSVGSDKPSEALRLALVRAKMIELLAKETEFNNKSRRNISSRTFFSVVSFARYIDGHDSRAIITE